MKSVAVVVIGAEVLSGKVADANGPHLIAELRSLGAHLGEMRVIDDEIETVATTVRELADRFNFVVTTGGIGPTHDDLTVKGIARAFDVAVIRDPGLEIALRTHYGEQLTESHLRLAEIPAGATIHAGPMPTIQMKNVFVLPGVPVLMRSCFDQVKEQFRGQAFITRVLYLDANEATIAEALTETVEAHPGVKIGSYPRFGDSSARVKVTVEGTHSGSVQTAVEQLYRTLPSGSILQDREETSL